MRSRCSSSVVGFVRGLSLRVHSLCVGGGRRDQRRSTWLLQQNKIKKRKTRAEEEEHEPFTMLAAPWKISPSNDYAVRLFRLRGTDPDEQTLGGSPALALALIWLARDAVVATCLLGNQHAVRCLFISGGGRVEVSVGWRISARFALFATRR